MIRRVVVLALGALLALALTAVPAGAAAPELRGVVSGSPYGASGGYVAVPVLYSKMTARRVGLKSPVGLMVVKRTERIKVTGAPSSFPINLRVGDRFKGVAEVSALNKRIFYPRITFEDAPSVYFRSKELSLAELTRLIQEVQANLGSLSKFTLDTFGLVATQLAGLQKQIDDLKALIAGLPSVDLSGIQKQINDLTGTLNGLIAGLPDFSTFALKTDIPGLPDLSAYALKTYVDAEIARIEGLIPTLPDLSPYALKSYVDAEIDKVKLLIPDVSGFLTQTDVNALINSAIAGLNLGQYATDADLAGLATTVAGKASQAALDAAEADLATVCNAVKGAQVTIDPDGAAGPLAPVTAPVNLGTSVNGVCP